MEKCKPTNQTGKNLSLIIIISLGKFFSSLKIFTAGNITENNGQSHIVGHIANGITFPERNLTLSFFILVPFGYFINSFLTTWAITSYIFIVYHFA
jgi:hypothetical protein